MEVELNIKVKIGSKKAIMRVIEYLSNEASEQKIQEFLNTGKLDINDYK